MLHGALGAEEGYPSQTMAHDLSGGRISRFNAGGHGFGMRTQGTTSDHWIDELYYWLEAHGLTKAGS